MKILIADDQGLYREGLIRHLKEIVPQASLVQVDNYAKTLELLNQEKFDFLILDLYMLDNKWVEEYERIHSKVHGAKIIIISGSRNIRDIECSLELGVVGYIPKRSHTNILVAALKLILDGGTYIPPIALKEGHTPCVHPCEGLRKHPSGATIKLTARQHGVLLLIAQGKSNKQIAYELGISEATVKLHINALLRALGAINRTQAVITAQHSGLI